MDSNNTTGESVPKDNHALIKSWWSKMSMFVHHFFHKPRAIGELYELSELVAVLHDGTRNSVGSVSAVVESSASRQDLLMFHRQWNRFSQSMTSQWQAMNYVSAVFVGTMATMLQDPAIFGHTVGRTCITAAFLCALASLCSGSILSIHISDVKAVHAAVLWTVNAHRMSSSLWLNPAITLATPAVWLLWSLSFFVTTLFASYVWQPPSLETHILSRVTVGCVLLTWLVQAISMVWTLHELKAVPKARLHEMPDVELDLEIGYNLMA